MFKNIIKKFSMIPIKKVLTISQIVINNETNVTAMVTRVSVHVRYCTVIDGILAWGKREI